MNGLGLRLRGQAAISQGTAIGALALVALLVYFAYPSINGFLNPAAAGVQTGVPYVPGVPQAPAPTPALSPGTVMPTEYGSLDSIVPTGTYCELGYQPQITVSGFAKERTGTRVALSFTGRVGTRDFNAAAGATAANINAGSGFNIMVYDPNSVYFNRTAKGALSCSGQSAILSEVPRAGGATVSVRQIGANSTTNSAGQCATAVQPGGTANFEIIFAENSTGTNFGYFTNPDSGKVAVWLDSNQTNTIDTSSTTFSGGVYKDDKYASNQNFELKLEAPFVLDTTNNLATKLLSLKVPATGNTVAENTTLFLHVIPYDYYISAYTNAPAVGASDANANLLHNRGINQQIWFCP